MSLPDNTELNRLEAKIALLIFECAYPLDEILKVITEHDERILAAQAEHLLAEVEAITEVTQGINKIRGDLK